MSVTSLIPRDLNHGRAHMCPTFGAACRDRPQPGQACRHTPTIVSIAAATMSGRYVASATQAIVDAVDGELGRQGRSRVWLAVQCKLTRPRWTPGFEGRERMDTADIDVLAQGLDMTMFELIGVAITYGTEEKA
jgi:hypothetical protein